MIFKDQIGSGNFKNLILSLLEKAMKIGLLPQGLEPGEHQDFQQNTYDIKAQLLGEFKVEINRTELNISRNRQKAVLAYLLLNRDRKIDRHTLANKFWGENETALNSLNVIISQLRDAFRKAMPQHEVIMTDGCLYYLNPALKIGVDANLLVKNYRNGNEAEICKQQDKALSYYMGGACLYNGFFLENLPLEGLDWIYGEREQLQQKWLVMLERLCNRFFEEGKHEFVVEFGERILDIVPHFEAIHEVIIRSHLAMDRIDYARHQYQYYLFTMESLDIPPSTRIGNLLNDRAA
jgi:DNA-binding SARP family transcriptional activator